MSTENKSKDQSWIRKIWLSNKVEVILCLIGVPVIGLNIILETPFLKLALQFVTIIWSQYQDIVLSIIICIIILVILGICIDAMTPNVKKSKIISWIEKPILYILSGVIPFTITTLVYNLWEHIHHYTPNIPQTVSLILFALLSTAGLAVIMEDLNKKIEVIVAWRAIKRLFLPLLALPIIIILSLLILDLTAIFSVQDLNSLYQRDLETRKFIFTLYAGALASIVFGVTLYVAYIRHTSLKLSEEQFKHAQEQFSYTQTQKQEEEIEKRFQEGIKLLGNEQESVRLGGIFVLWEIVKDAVKALPYLENENIYYAEYTNDKAQKYILPYRLTVPDANSDIESQIKLKNQYHEKNSASEAEVSAYKKAFSLHEQILNILCAHVRTKTNSENYLKEYYPSIYQKRYPQKFKEFFGSDGEFNHLKKYEEKPSNEIQTLMDLIVKVPTQLSNIHSEEKSLITEKFGVLTYALNFRPNFENSVFKHLNCERAHFEKTNCSYTNFEYACCIHSHFTGAVCEGAIFRFSNCESASFYGANCDNANFDSSICTNTSFENTYCRKTSFKCSYVLQANFLNADCTKATFSGSKLIQTTFSANITKAIFDGINSQLGEVGVLSDPPNQPSLRLYNNNVYIDVNTVNSIKCATKTHCPSLLMKEPWRITTSEINYYLELVPYLIFFDNTTIENLWMLQKSYTAFKAKSGKILDFEKLYKQFSTEEKIYAKKYLYDFDNLLNS